MPPAVIGGGIAAVGAIGGAVLGSKAQKSAAKTAANAETQASQANIAAAKDFYNRNTANLNPFLQSGIQANSLVNSFLYGPPQGGAQPGQTGGGQSNPGYQEPDFRAGLPSRDQWATGALNAIGVQPGGNPILSLQGAITHLTPQQQRNWAGYLGSHPDPDTVYEQRQADYRQQHGMTNPHVAGQAPQPVGGGTQTNALSGYEAFKNSPFYQFGLTEGMNQLNHGLASRGMLESGDAMKSAIRFGQDYGSQRMGEFINLAENQANRGLQAGGAIAGVGVNALNTTTMANNAIGNAAANRAIAGGIANSNLYSGIGNALGTFAGTVFK